MIRVRFFSSFCDSKGAIDVFCRILKIINIPEYGKDIIFVDDESYTHAVIMNIATPSLKIPKENVLGLAFEPNAFLHLNKQFISYATKHIGRYYIGDSKGLSSPFIEHHGFMWHAPFPNTILPKTKLMSIIFSEKNFSEGHKYRYSLVNEIFKNNLPIDIYGRGCRFIRMNDSRIKGEFKDEEPYDGYQFSIAIENYRLPAYISEKYLNCLLYETTPIYFGCENLSKIYPNTTIFLSGNLDKDLPLLKDIIANPDKYRKKIDRYDVLKNHNLIKHLYELWK
jgi:hypothetical protein